MLERLGNLLFELSSEERILILHTLKDKSLNLTQISKKIELSTQQTSRHLSRLSQTNLIKREPSGDYSISRLGELVLLQLDELLFSTSNEAYLLSHDFQFLPNQYVKRLSDLSQATVHGNVLDFIRKVEEIIEDAEDYVWLNVDQYSTLALSQLLDAIEKGVKIKIIERKDAGSGYIQTTHDDRIEYRISDEKQVFLVLTEKSAVFSLPNSLGEYDYRGFIGEDIRFHGFCHDLFEYLWDNSEPRLDSLLKSDKVEVRRGSAIGGSITIVGRDDPMVDRLSIQEAVDNYDEVILQGNFNLGSETKTATIQLGSDMINHWSSSISISRSITIRGEIDKDGNPLTKVYKQSWPFPTGDSESYSVFQINGEDIDVLIENLCIQNFNGNAITTVNGNSVKLRNNRVTVDNGVGRGVYFSNQGDTLTGFSIGAYNRYNKGGFSGGVEITGNYLDFAVSTRGGFIIPGATDDPFYRPNLLAHEGYVGIGIQVQNIIGDVVIRDNVVRNMNSRGIIIFDLFSESEVLVENNKFESDIFGSYAWFSKHSGFGIFVQSSLLAKREGFNVKIRKNLVTASRINYSGIGVFGPIVKGGAKLVDGVISENSILLDDGLMGIQIRKCDGFKIQDNHISGQAYYGIVLSGRRNIDELDLGSNSNQIINNDFSGLVIKPSDEYGSSNIDDRNFTDQNGSLKTAQIWLNKFTKNNDVTLDDFSEIIDDGGLNSIKKPNSNSL